MSKPRTNQTIKKDFALLAEVFEQAPSFMAVLSGQDHIFEMVNPAYYQLVGHRDTLGKTGRAVFPEITEQGYFDLLDAVFQTGVPFIGKEMRVQLQVTPDMPLVERYVNFVFQARYDSSGIITGVFVHGVDVTELVRARKESEQHAEHIKQQTTIFNTALNNIPDIIYIFDRSGRFIYVNAPFLSLINLSHDEIIGKTCFELPYTIELATTVQNYITEVIATGKQVRDETQFVNPAGYDGYYEYTFSPVFDDEGNVSMIAGSTRDITEQIRLARQKDEFLSMVSHELKTPITSLKAYAQILQRRFTKDGHDSAASHMAKMDAQIDKLTGLINDLLDVTKITNGQVPFHEAPFSLDEIIIEAIEEVQRTIDHHQIHFTGATHRTIYGDRDRIGQVIINLLTNAIKYSPAADSVLVSATTTAMTATVCVRDFGIGVGAEHLPHLFERFYRVEHHTAVTGLGLGLSIASDIIQRHNGTIWAESVLGQGTALYFTVPTLPEA